MSENIVKPAVKKAQGSKISAQGQILQLKTTKSTITKPVSVSKPLDNYFKLDSAQQFPSIKPAKKFEGQSSTQAINEEKKDFFIQKVTFINIELSKTREMVTKLKELQDIQKINAQEINLNLNTNFQSDSDMANFAMTFIKIANKINNLNWIIKGKWKDEGSGRYIGELLIKCTKLYHLQLDISPSFGDQSASTLALALRKLPNLRILKIYLAVRSLSKDNKFTECGNDKLNESIESLKKLDILEYNGRICNSGLNNLSNFVYFVYEEDFSTDSQVNAGQNVIDFKKQMSLIGERIIYLNIQNQDQMFRYVGDCLEEPPINYSNFNKIYQRLLPYIAQLPYLTSFRKTFRQQYEEDQEKEDQPISRYEIIIHNLIQFRLAVIQQIIFLENDCLHQIPLNPRFIIADLFID